MTRSLSFTSRNSDHPQHGYPLGRIGRLLLVGWSLVLLGGFSLASALDPDPRGYGTHRELGLPPCTFQDVYGTRCPSCGMTTSFAHFVRGEFLQAAQANAAGVLLAAVCAVQVPWCWVSVWRKRLWRIARPETAVLWLVMSVGGVGLLQWFLRMAGV